MDLDEDALSGTHLGGHDDFVAELRQLIGDGDQAVPLPGVVAEPFAVVDVADPVLEDHEHLRAMIDTETVAGAEILVDPDPVLRRHLLQLKRATRARYEQLVADAVSVGELRADTDVRALARMIEVTLDGSFLAWTLYREGSAAERLRDDLEATLRPYLVRGVKRKGLRR